MSLDLDFCELILINNKEDIYIKTQQMESGKWKLSTEEFSSFKNPLKLFYHESLFNRDALKNNLKNIITFPLYETPKYFIFECKSCNTLINEPYYYDEHDMRNIRFLEDNLFVDPNGYHGIKVDGNSKMFLNGCTLSSKYNINCIIIEGYTISEALRKDKNLSKMRLPPKESLAFQLMWRFKRSWLKSGKNFYIIYNNTLPVANKDIFDNTIKFGLYYINDKFYYYWKELFDLLGDYTTTELKKIKTINYADISNNSKNSKDYKYTNDKTNVNEKIIYSSEKINKEMKEIDKYDKVFAYTSFIKLEKFLEMGIYNYVMSKLNKLVNKVTSNNNGYILKTFEIFNIYNFSFCWVSKDMYIATCPLISLLLKIEHNLKFSKNKIFNFKNDILYRENETVIVKNTHFELRKFSNDEISIDNLKITLYPIFNDVKLNNKMFPGFYSIKLLDNKFIMRCETLEKPITKEKERFEGITMMSFHNATNRNISTKNINPLYTRYFLFEAVNDKISSYNFIFDYKQKIIKKTNQNLGHYKLNCVVSSTSIPQNYKSYIYKIKGYIT